MESLLEKTTKWTPYKNLKIIKFKAYFYSNTLFLKEKTYLCPCKIKIMYYV